MLHTYMKKDNSLFIIGMIGLSIGGISYIHNIFGPYKQWIPDFLHPFCFSLLTIRIFSRSRCSRAGCCLLWVTIDSIFEIGQNYASMVVLYIPSWFSNIPIFGNTKSYFINGRFDIIDIMAIGIGGISAFILSEGILGGVKDASKSKKFKARDCIPILQKGH